MTAANVRIEAQANVLHFLAVDVTRALEHIQRELAACDWHPADTMGGGLGSHGTPASPTERVALARSELTGAREQIRDDIAAVESVVRSLRHVVDETLKLRTPSTELFAAADHGVRCSGKVDATCTNWASPHTLHGGNIIGTLCDTCWEGLCAVCGTHAHEGRRVDGFRSCENAYRRHLRAVVKGAA